MVRQRAACCTQSYAASDKTKFRTHVHDVDAMESQFLGRVQNGHRCTLNKAHKSTYTESEHLVQRIPTKALDLVVEHIYEYANYRATEDGSALQSEILSLISSGKGARSPQSPQLKHLCARSGGRNFVVGIRTSQHLAFSDMPHLRDIEWDVFHTLMVKLKGRTYLEGSVIRHVYRDLQFKGRIGAHADCVFGRVGNLYSKLIRGSTQKERKTVQDKIKTDGKHASKRLHHITKGVGLGVHQEAHFDFFLPGEHGALMPRFSKVSRGGTAYAMEEAKCNDRGKADPKPERSTIGEHPLQTSQHSSS